MSVKNKDVLYLASKQELAAIDSMIRSIEIMIDTVRYSDSKKTLHLMRLVSMLDHVRVNVKPQPKD
jgi:hypothetical protein